MRIKNIDQLKTVIISQNEITRLYVCKNEVTLTLSEVLGFDSVMLEVYYRLQIFVIMSGFEMQIFSIQNRYENIMAWSGIHSLCKKVAIQTHLQLQEF